MRILQVITSLSMGGAEKLMVDLVPRFRAMGAETDLLIFDGTDTPLRREAEARGVRVLDFGKGGSVYNPLHILRLRRLMRRYDIVHTHNTSPQLFAAAAEVLCSVVLCTTEHNTSNRRRGWKWYARLDRWMYGRYRKVICISDKAETNLRRHLGDSKADIITVYNGVDVARYRDAQPSDELRGMLPADGRAIVMVAGFRWEKDQDTLIRAMSRLPQNFRLFLVGQGVRQDECRRLAEARGVADRVVFMGLRTDVPQLLKGADYIVMSSHFEGLSLSSVEGMSAGHPFIASCVDGLREVVEGAGVMFEHGNDRALADAIVELEADPALRDSVSRACAERAARYDIDTMARNYMRVYRDIMDGR